MMFLCFLKKAFFFSVLQIGMFARHVKLSRTSTQADVSQNQTILKIMKAQYWFVIRSGHFQ